MTANAAARLITIFENDVIAGESSSFHSDFLGLSSSEVDLCNLKKGI
jgi:hypothetical protein